MLAAPTGKAARNLTERTGIEARTIHGALGKIPDANFLDAVSWNQQMNAVAGGLFKNALPVRIRWQRQFTSKEGAAQKGQ